MARRYGPPVIAPSEAKKNFVYLKSASNFRSLW